MAATGRYSDLMISKTVTSFTSIIIAATITILPNTESHSPITTTMMTRITAIIMMPVMTTAILTTMAIRDTIHIAPGAPIRPLFTPRQASPDTMAALIQARFQQLAFTTSGPITRIPVPRTLVQAVAVILRQATAAV